MKKSKIISLVLISSSLASCYTQNENNVTTRKHVFFRTDSTADYAIANTFNRDEMMWYYAFRPYGYYNNGNYYRGGFYSNGIPFEANTGNNQEKKNIIRGGFGIGLHSTSS